MLIEPVPINLPNAKSPVIDIACGRAHTVVLTEREGAFTLGHNGYGQCGRPIVENEDYQRRSLVHQIKSDVKFTQVVCGQDHRYHLIGKLHVGLPLTEHVFGRLVCLSHRVDPSTLVAGVLMVRPAWVTTTIRNELRNAAETSKESGSSNCPAAPTVYWL